MGLAPTKAWSRNMQLFLLHISGGNLYSSLNLELKFSTLARFVRLLFDSKSMIVYTIHTTYGYHFPLSRIVGLHQIWDICNAFVFDNRRGGVRAYL